MELKANTTEQEFKIIEDVKHPAGVVAYEYGGG